ISTVPKLDSSGTNWYQNGGRRSRSVTRKPSLKSNVQAVPESVSVGRKRDRLLDAKILDATLDVLAEVGASGLTMDLVAARAGSGKGAIYRRWESKSDLVVDAIAQLKRGHIDLPNLPDT